MATQHHWDAENGAKLPSDPSQPFTLSSPPNSKTDIWRPSAKDDVFTAPVVWTKVPTSSFKTFSVTVSAAWKTHYDQGGIIIAFPTTDSAQPRRWVKAGIEYFQDAPHLSVVGTDRYSDWSVAPMQPGKVQATFEAVREGTTMWVYGTVGDAQPVRQPLREIKWAFVDVRDDDEMNVGVYVAKPTPDAEGADKILEVTYSNLQLETSK